MEKEEKSTKKVIKSDHVLGVLYRDIDLKKTVNEKFIAEHEYSIKYEYKLQAPFIDRCKDKPSHLKKLSGYLLDAY